MSLTDEQCAEIAQESRRLAALVGTPRVTVVIDHPPGSPSWMGDEELVLHPDDFHSLRGWADRQPPRYTWR